MTRSPLVALGAGIILAGLLASGVAAASPVNQHKIRPHQAFVGLVNGATTNATIDVNCPGPLRLGQTGNPLPNQTMAVASPVASTATVIGFTGSRGHSIVASLISASATSASGLTLTFTTYGAQPIPTSILLPCTGTATAVFVPRPTSSTARNSHVDVTFEPTCESTVCPTTRPS